MASYIEFEWGSYESTPLGSTVVADGVRTWYNDTQERFAVLAERDSKHLSNIRVFLVIGFERAVQTAITDGVYNNPYDYYAVTVNKRTGVIGTVMNGRGNIGVNYLVSNEGTKIAYGDLANWIINPLNTTQFTDLIPYPDLQTAVNDVWDVVTDKYPITYYEIHSNLSGPSEAAAGEEVTVDVSFPDGYKLKNATQGSGISVHDQYGYVDFTYDETARQIKFTMPTPE